MFLETYRQENSGSIMACGDARPIPYPKISQEDWRAWTLFLPVQSATPTAARTDGSYRLLSLNPEWLTRCSGSKQ